MNNNLILGNCLDIMKKMDENSIDSIVTDPPYGLKFMGKEWDRGVPGIEFWIEALRVAKPGAHLLAFGGTRMVHHLAVAIEDAGWEIRDRIHWVYGSGFPKSHNVSKAIDKAAGAEREVVRIRTDGNKGGGANTYDDDSYVWDKPFAETAPATPEAQRWDGWGTALKPAVEPIILARKPFRGTVAANVLEWGTGAINVDGCRVETGDNLNGGAYSKNRKPSESDWVKIHSSTGKEYQQPEGRWPANLIHDGSDGATEGMGDASRYFYCAKASKKDRGSDNTHPTVKPTDLMRYLCRLITPPNGIVLDPFMGSGSTGRAAIAEGFSFVGCELDEEFYKIAQSRIQQQINKKSRDVFN